ncbi:MAG: iron-sulfur cluster assembly protein, partial [Methyloceanibacter sp.]
MIAPTRPYPATIENLVFRLVRNTKGSMSDLISKERVLEALKRVKGPNLSDDIVSLGLISEIVIRGG